MLKKTILLENKASVTTKNFQLVIKSEIRESTIPVEDIGFLVIDHPEIYLSIPAMNLLIENNTALILCSKNHMPNGMFLNLNSHHIQQEVFKNQIDASVPLKKQLWQQTVIEKITNQGVLLKKITNKTLFNKSLLANYWERLWLKKKYKQCNNQFIAISEDVKHFLSENLEEFRNRIQLVPNAINTSRFHTDRSYSNVNEPFQIVSIANLVPKKNHVLLIGVMEILLKKGFNVRMDVLGAGPLMDTLINETKEKGLDNHLRFLGSVGDIPERLKKAQLYVHPAKYEPFGLVILEAMASGLPVVSVDGFGNRELMKEGENGFMVPNNVTAEDFAKKVIYFINNPSEIERMGKFAVEFSKHYDIDHYSHRLIEIYSS